MPTRGRTVAGVLLGFSFTLGQLILAGVAYLVRPWRWLQFAVSVPFLIFSLYSWYVLSRVGGVGGGGGCPCVADLSLWRPGVCSDWDLLGVVVGDAKRAELVGPRAPEYVHGYGEAPEKSPTLAWVPEQSECFCLFNSFVSHDHLPAFCRRGPEVPPRGVHDLLKARHWGQTQIQNQPVRVPSPQQAPSVLSASLCDVF